MVAQTPKKSFTIPLEPAWSVSVRVLPIYRRRVGLGVLHSLGASLLPKLVQRLLADSRVCLPFPLKQHWDYSSPQLQTLHEGSRDGTEVRFTSSGFYLT